jgi:hypothetical protein
MSGRPHPYASPAYARALSPGGDAIAVPDWGSFVLGRATPDGSARDAAGAYPLAAIAPEADLAAGRDALARSGLVSLVMVPDPLWGPPAGAFASGFELWRPFKTHQLVDAGRPYAPSRHHRDRVRRAARRCRIERVQLADWLGPWQALYDGLVERRAITGPAAFGPAYFAALAQEARLVTFAAFVGETLAAATLWFEHRGVVYNHLTASGALGYANGAGFLLYDAAIRHFSGAGVINLGAGAGLDDDPEDGLAAFKRGFANATVQAWLAGAVLDPAAYARLSRGRAAGGFFPAYRG